MKIDYVDMINDREAKIKNLEKQLAEEKESHKKEIEKLRNFRSTHKKVKLSGEDIHTLERFAKAKNYKAIGEIIYAWYMYGIEVGVKGTLINLFKAKKQQNIEQAAYELGCLVTGKEKEPFVEDVMIDAEFTNWYSNQQEKIQEQQEEANSFNMTFFFFLSAGIGAIISGAITAMVFS